MATESLLLPAADFEAAVSGLLSSLSPSASSTTAVYTDDVFERLSKYLVQAGKQEWSKRPRTYLVLRLINRVDSMDAFVLDGLLDIALPYTYNRLPSSLSAGTRNAFLGKQGLVMSKAGDLEMESGRHRHFSSTAESNFIIVKQLGSGYFGIVDHVRSKLSYEEYARKRTLRARTFSKDKKALKMFENELSNLKRLSHLHLVKYVGSYTDPQYIGLLTSPVADCDLKVFLSQVPFPNNLISLLRSFLGCLCSAVSYLHSQKCRHKDIKPGNILVKSDVVLITDFGTSRNWSDRSKGTTTGESGPYTPGYAAPEVVAWEARNESSDIWSLGCVYLDILSVIKGENLVTKDKFFADNGNGGRNPRVNTQALTLWLAKMEAVGYEDNQPISWIKQMLQVGPKDRISSVHLLDYILGYADEHIYYGHCCADHEGELSSCHSSEFADDGSSIEEGGEDSTNATSAVSKGAPHTEPDAEKDTQSQPQTANSEVTKTPGQVTEGNGNSGSQSIPGAGNITSLVNDAAFPEGKTSGSEPPTDIASSTISHDTDGLQTLTVKDNSFSALPNIPIRTAGTGLPTRSPHLGAQAPSKSEHDVSKNPFRNPFISGNPSASDLSPDTVQGSNAGSKNLFDTFFADLDQRSKKRENVETFFTGQDYRSRSREIAVEDPEPSGHGQAGSIDRFYDPFVPPVQQPAEETLADNGNLRDDLSTTMRAAATGNVADVLRYFLTRESGSWNEFGKEVFHVAALQSQRFVLQALINIGCPISASDVADYVLPMRARREIEVDYSNPVHKPLIDQIGLLPDHYSTSTYTYLRDQPEHPTQIPRALSVWDPGALHFGIKVRPDPLALHHALAQNDYTQLLLRISEGVDPNVRNDKGWSPLDFAISTGYLPFIKVLVRNGADPLLKGRNGQTAYDLAASLLPEDKLSEVLKYFKDNEDGSWKVRQTGLTYKSVDASWPDFLAQVELQRLGEEDFWVRSWQIAVPARFHWSLHEILGILEWREVPPNVVEPYPDEVFELHNTAVWRVEPFVREEAGRNVVDPYPNEVFELGNTYAWTNLPLYYPPSDGPSKPPARMKRGLFSNLLRNKK